MARPAVPLGLGISLDGFGRRPSKAAVQGPFRGGGAFRARRKYFLETSLIVRSWFCKMQARLHRRKKDP